MPHEVFTAITFASVGSRFLIFRLFSVCFVLRLFNAPHVVNTVRTCSQRHNCSIERIAARSKLFELWQAGIGVVEVIRSSRVKRFVVGWFEFGHAAICLRREVKYPSPHLRMQAVRNPLFYSDLLVDGKTASKGASNTS